MTVLGLILVAVGCFMMGIWLVLRMQLAQLKLNAANALLVQLLDEVFEDRHCSQELYDKIITHLEDSKRGLL
jgi:hypothetical protein